MQKLIFTFFFSLVITSCSVKTHTLTVRYENSPTPAKPDYSKVESWAALPTKVDAADSTPRKSTVTNNQVSAKADVFFVYPTIFTDAPKNEYQWNADVNDVALNNDIQRSTLLNQATAFNGACRVFAPYYRQAHLFAFYTPNPEDGKQALDLAYQDVKAAFEYYLEHYNQGRPIVIASHSQGSYHCERLLQDYFDGKELQNQLVAAYLIGRAISPQAFQHISPTKTPDEIGVWASWNTFARNYIPTNYARYQNALSTNPLLWNASEEYAAKELNKGGVALKFTYAPHLVDAQNHQGLLWVSRPNIKGSWLFKHKVWHRADINFFYMNIRENVALRVEKFLEVNGSKRSIGK
jgi:hypothetical protein